MLSIFEIVGPVMIGPSSSHTAGMARIGKMAYYIAGPDPVSIALHLSPKMKNTYQGHRSDAALIGGAMGFMEDDSKIRNGIEIAHENGISTSVDFLPEGVYPQNTAYMVIKTKDGDTTGMVGTSIGGGSIIITEVDGVKLNISPETHHVLIWSDAPVAFDTIEVEKVQSGSKDGVYITCLTFNKKPADELLDAIKGTPAVKKVHLIEPVLTYGCTISESVNYTSYAAIIEEQKKTGKTVADIAIDYECARTGNSKEDVIQRMLDQLEQMKESVRIGIKGNKMLYGLISGEDGKRMMEAIQAKKTISGGIIPIAVARAIAVMEYNGSMGCVVAAPTAGSAGVVPGSIVTIQEAYNLSDLVVAKSLFVAGLAGVVMGNRDVSFSGSVGGCEGEVGVSSAITAAALTSLFTDDAATIFDAMGMCIKNILGLVCDPISGPVEVPCIKRNAMGVTNAYTSADMALAGITSYIPPDEVIDALVDVERRLPPELKCATIGGLACTKTAKALRKRLHQE